MMTTETNRVTIPDRLYFRIGDVAELAGVKTYVLRYWESEFPIIQPQKSATGQRIYRRSDVESILMIKHLLYNERYSIEGALKRINELRAEGQLKSFKQETASPGKDPRSEERLKKAAALASQLRSQGQVPISKLFAY